MSWWLRCCLKLDTRMQDWNLTFHLMFTQRHSVLLALRTRRLCLFWNSWPNPNDTVLWNSHSLMSHICSWRQGLLTMLNRHIPNARDGSEQTSNLTALLYQCAKECELFTHGKSCTGNLNNAAARISRWPVTISWNIWLPNPQIQP